MSIPASAVVSINPGVLSSGGNPLSLNGLFLSQNAYIPTNTVQSFTSSDAVKAFFGAASAEYAQSLIYFNGFDNSTQKPGTIYFAPYVAANRGAWLQGGSLASLTLTQLQALSGILSVTVDGVLKTSSNINLSAATSFSNAATLIATAFTSGPAVTWDAVKGAFIVASNTTGASSSITFGSGTISTGLALTSATGAILSQGDTVDTPSTCLDMVKGQNQNWAAFTTLWEPDTATKTLFALWVQNQSQRFTYVAWDTDAQAIVNGSTTAFGVLAKAAAYDGVAVVYNTLALASFVLGTIASIDFARRNARITLAFKSQSGFTPTVTDQQTGDNLIANGYSFYGAYATANDQFNFFYNGQMAGKWKWIDPYVNQIYMNAQFQLALVTLLTNSGAIPYNDAGYSLIRGALIDPITSALNFGGIRAGVKLSQLQKGAVNAAAGLDVASVIENQGYYLQVLDPGAQIRGNRGTPVINFWYTDGGAVQKLVVPSIDIM